MTSSARAASQLYLNLTAGSQSMNFFAGFMSERFSAGRSMLVRHVEASNKVFSHGLLAAELLSANNHKEHTT